MKRSQSDRNALVRAGLASIALHLILVPFFAVMRAPSETNYARADGGSNETMRSVRLTFDHRSVRRPTQTARTAKPNARTMLSQAPTPHRRLARVAPPVAMRGKIATASTRTGASRERSHHHVARALDAPASQHVARATASPEPVAAATQAIVAAAVPAQTPAPGAEVASAPTPLAIVAAREGDVPPGGWGQSFAKPLVADDDALAGIRAKFHGIRIVAIDVDPSGRATRIEIPAGVTGDARAELERILSALRYVPAECNGLRCAGTLQLVL